MTGEKLIEEGRRLAKPCFYLNDKDEGELAAVWGGPGLVPHRKRGTYKHWLTVNARFLPQTGAGLSGCMSV